MSYPVIGCTVFVSEVFTRNAERERMNGDPEDDSGLLLLDGTLVCRRGRLKSLYTQVT